MRSLAGLFLEERCNSRTLHRQRVKRGKILPRNVSCVSYVLISYSMSDGVLARRVEYVRRDRSRSKRLAKESYELLVQPNACLNLRFMPEEFTAALKRSANGISPSWKNYKKVQADSFAGSREAKNARKQGTRETNRSRDSLA